MSKVPRLTKHYNMSTVMQAHAHIHIDAIHLGPDTSISCVKFWVGFSVCSVCLSQTVSLLQRKHIVLVESLVVLEPNM